MNHNENTEITFDITETSHTKRYIFFQSLGFASIGASLWSLSTAVIKKKNIFASSSLRNTLTAFFACFSLSWVIATRRSRNYHSAFESLRKQNVEGMHFMKFESLAAPLSPESFGGEVTMEEIKKLIADADSKDERLMKKSFTYEQSVLTPK